MTAHNDRLFEIWLREARRLRTAADASERDFMLHLRAGEKKPQLWLAKGATFDQVLELYDICKGTRYRLACKALDEIPMNTVKKIGMAAATVAVGVPEQQRENVVSDMVAKAETTGVP
ncbi:MAG: hypothetical protein HC882_08375 [Acidobacteria bacterium]|nr:hypothetical protein [Acidobacteriota bacterium]